MYETGHENFRYIKMLTQKPVMPSEARSAQSRHLLIIKKISPCAPHSRDDN